MQSLLDLRNQSSQQQAPQAPAEVQPIQEPEPVVDDGQAVVEPNIEPIVEPEVVVEEPAPVSEPVIEAEPEPVSEPIVEPEPILEPTTL